MLKKLQGKRITIKGTFDAWGRNNSVLVQHVTDEQDNELLDHSWIQAAENFIPFVLKRGERVQFSAVCMSYRSKEGEERFGFRLPTSIVLLDRVEQPKVLYPAENLDPPPENSPPPKPRKQTEGDVMTGSINEKLEVLNGDTARAAAVDGGNARQLHDSTAQEIDACEQAALADTAEEKTRDREPTGIEIVNVKAALKTSGIAVEDALLYLPPLIELTAVAGSPQKLGVILTRLQQILA